MGYGSIPGGVRFVCHVPFFMLAILGTINYTYVKKHSQVLLTPPYNKQKILAAQEFSGPGVRLRSGTLPPRVLTFVKGVVLFVYNFFSWIPTTNAEGKRLLLLGLADTVAVVLLLYALCVESTFVGFTHAQCASVHGNATADPRLLFFDRAGTINLKDAGLGKSTCQRFLAKWYLLLVIT